MAGGYKVLIGFYIPEYCMFDDYPLLGLNYDPPVFGLVYPKFEIPKSDFVALIAFLTSYK